MVNQFKQLEKHVVNIHFDISVNMGFEHLVHQTLISTHTFFNPNGMALY